MEVKEKNKEVKDQKEWKQFNEGVFQPSSCLIIYNAFCLYIG